MAICNFVVSQFGFEGWAVVLMAPVPCHCLPFTFQYSHVKYLSFFAEHKL